MYKRRAPLLRLRGLGKSIRTDLLNPLNQRYNSSVGPPPSRPRSKARSRRAGQVNDSGIPKELVRSSTLKVS